jgi:hypothetical protein
MMARYYTDFTNVSLEDLTTQSDTTLSIEDDVSAVGGKRLKISGDDGEFLGFSWNSINADSQNFLIDSIVKTVDAPVAGVGLINNAFTDGFLFYFYNDWFFNEKTIILSQLADDVESTLATYNTSNGYSVAKFRIRTSLGINGTTLSAKAWDASLSEPSEWDVSHTMLSDYVSKYDKVVYFGVGDGTPNQWFADELGVGTNGQLTPTDFVSDKFIRPDTNFNQLNVHTLDSDAIITNTTHQSPPNGFLMTIRIQDNGVARSLFWESQYRAIVGSLPSTTVPGNVLYITCIYNATESLWDVLYHVT